MSIYRTLLAMFAALVISSPVIAEETTEATQSTPGSAMTTETTTMSVTQTKVNLNKATAKDLLKVKGINAAKARAIVSYRKKNGNFMSVDDLSKVKNFKKLKPAMLKKIQDQLTVE